MALAMALGAPDGLRLPRRALLRRAAEERVHEQHVMRALQVEGGASNDPADWKITNKVQLYNRIL